MITVYSKPACVQCKATYHYLAKAGLQYKIVDLTRDEEAAAYVASLGYQSAPVVVTDDQHWSGFCVDKIESLVQ
jgi:glutaredoxin-like protein NrdH